jgi:hypothetical protein
MSIVPSVYPLLKFKVIVAKHISKKPFYAKLITDGHTIRRPPWKSMISYPDEILQTTIILRHPTFPSTLIFTGFQYTNRIGDVTIIWDFSEMTRRTPLLFEKLHYK